MFTITKRYVRNDSKRNTLHDSWSILMEINLYEACNLLSFDRDTQSLSIDLDTNRPLGWVNILLYKKFHHP